MTPARYSIRRLIAGPACTNVRAVLRPAVFAVVTLALVAAGCGQSVPGPRSVDLGRSTCARCGHLISTLDAAAQVAYPDGTARLYNDLGCMATDQVALRGRGELYCSDRRRKGLGPRRRRHVRLAAWPDVPARLQLLRVPRRGIAPPRARSLGARLERSGHGAGAETLSHAPVTSSSRATSSSVLKKWQETRTPPTPDV